MRQSVFTGTGVIPINTVLIPSTLTERAVSLSLQIASLGTTGQVKVQLSNNDVDWEDALCMQQSGTPLTSITAKGLYTIALNAAYWRVILSVATTTGNTNIVGYARTTSMIVEGSANSASAISTLPSVTVGTLPATPTGSNLIGSVVANISATAALGPTLSVARLLASAASTNATSVKASAGRLVDVRGLNNVASVRYLKFYNKASAPTVGTDVPVLTYALRASDVFSIDLNSFGHLFTTGIAYAITGAAADADTTAIAANDILGMNIRFI